MNESQCKCQMRVRLYTQSSECEFVDTPYTYCRECGQLFMKKMVEKEFKMNLER